MNTAATINMQVSKMDTDHYSPYWDGFTAYCEGQQLEDMPTEAHERGWWAANQAQGACEMPVCVQPESILYVDDTTEYVEDILDREFWARGQW